MVRIADCPNMTLAVYFRGIVITSKCMITCGQFHCLFALILVNFSSIPATVSDVTTETTYHPTQPGCRVAER